MKEMGIEWNTLDLGLCKLGLCPETGYVLCPASLGNWGTLFFSVYCLKSQMIIATWVHNQFLERFPEKTCISEEESVYIYLCPHRTILIHTLVFSQYVTILNEIFLWLELSLTSAVRNIEWSLKKGSDLSMLCCKDTWTGSNWIKSEVEIMATCLVRNLGFPGQC